MSISIQINRNPTRLLSWNRILQGHKNTTSEIEESKFKDSLKVQQFVECKSQLTFILLTIFIIQIILSLAQLIYSSKDEGQKDNISSTKALVYLAFLVIFALTNFLFLKFMKTSKVLLNDFLSMLLFLTYTVMTIEFQNIQNKESEVEFDLQNSQFTRFAILKPFAILSIYYFYHCHILNSMIQIISVIFSTLYIILRLHQPANNVFGIIEAVIPLIFTLVFRLLYQSAVQVKNTKEQKTEFRRFKYFFKNSTIGFLEMINPTSNGYFNHAFENIFSFNKEKSPKKKVTKSCCVENFLTLPNILTDKKIVGNEEDKQSFLKILNSTKSLTVDSSCLRTFSKLKTIHLITDKAEKHKLIYDVKNEAGEMFRKLILIDSLFTGKATNKTTEFNSSHNVIGDAVSSLWNKLEQISEKMGFNATSSSMEKSVKISFEIKHRLKFMAMMGEDDNKRLLKILISPYFIESSPRLMVEVIDKSDKVVIQDLKKQEDTQTKVVSSVSHELRQPLNGIISMMELLSESVTVALLDKYVKPVIASSKQLLYLVNDILDVSQVKDGNLRIVNGKFKLVGMIDEVCSLLEIQAKNRGILLLKQIPTFLLKKKITTDQIRVKQIILNLLSNALKFTYFGSITLKVEQVDNEVYKFQIIDTGCGIKDEDKSKLFKRFGKLDLGDNNFMNNSGVGLGLQISYALAKRLGPPDNSSITLESKFGAGSTFSFLIFDHTMNSIIPENFTESSNDSLLLESRKCLKKTSISPNLLEKRKGNNNKFSSLLGMRCSLEVLELRSNADSSRFILPMTCSCPKVLIVDDNDMNIIVLQRLFENLDIPNDSATSGENALTKILIKSKESCCKSFFLIFMDANLPFKSGKDITIEIKDLVKKGAIGDSYIIGCTGDTSEVMKEILMDAGMADVLHKPVSIKSLKGVVQRFTPELLSNENLGKI